MNNRRCLWLLLCLMAFSLLVHAEEQAADEEAVELRFDITSYTVEGSTLLTQDEIDEAVAPYIGKNKDFSDVQLALEAIEEAYAKRGYSGVHVLLPEQELEQGRVRFRAIESRYGKITVTGQQHFSEAGVLRALPSLRPGNVPSARQLGRELRLANENPARMLNVVMKGGGKEDEMDAEVRVSDQDPSTWGVSFDNTGTAETGRTRLGLFYRHANLMDADHVGMIQTQVSPQHMDRVRVFSGSYKIPMYESNGSLEFFGGYSNVNSLVKELNNFQGGGRLFGVRYNQLLDKVAGFEPHVVYGLDWRNFNKVEQTKPFPIVLYNEITVTPVSLGVAATDKQERSEASLELTYSVNLPLSKKGKQKQFDGYDAIKVLRPDMRYRILRYAMGYSQTMGEDWQVRGMVNGQWTDNVLILSEQMRLGGMNGVRGFTEGSEAGEKGVRWTLEGYTPAGDFGGVATRALMFYDGGRVSSRSGLKTIIGSYGVGIRMNWQQVSFRVDAGRIAKAGSDPLQKKGDWRMHASIMAMF